MKFSIFTEMLQAIQNKNKRICSNKKVVSRLISTIQVFHRIGVTGSHSRFVQGHFKMKMHQLSFFQTVNSVKSRITCIWELILQVTVLITCMCTTHTRSQLVKKKNAPRLSVLTGARPPPTQNRASRSNRNKCRSLGHFTKISKSSVKIKVKYQSCLYQARYTRAML